MTGVARFEDLECWKTARELTRLAYGSTNEGAFPRDLGLRDQIRRAFVSVMSNIAEGFESRTDVQLINYLGHAKGSAGETRWQLYVALDMGYVTQDQFCVLKELAEKASRQVSRFITYLEAQPRGLSLRDETPESGTNI